MKFIVMPFLFCEDTISKTEAAAFIPEIWANRALGKLRKQTVFISLCSRDYNDAIARQGDTINVPKRGLLQANNKVASTAVTLQNPTASTIPVVLTDHKEVSFLVEDVAESQANMSIVDGYVEDAAIVLGEAADLAVAGLYAGIASDKTVFIGAGPLEQADITGARTKIVTDGPYPGTAPRALVIRDMAEMLAVENFTSREKIANNDALASGVVGRIAGFDVYENQNVVKTLSPVATKRLAFATGTAVTFVTRRLASPPANSGVQVATIVEDGVAIRVLYGYNMNYLGLQVTLDMLFGVKTMRSELLTLITEGTADSSGA